MFSHLLGTAKIVGSCYGINFRRLYSGLKNTRRFFRDMRTYRAGLGSSHFPETQRYPIIFSDLAPQLADYEAAAGSSGGSYFFQDLWAARKIYLRKPVAHLDVGSRIDGFITHLLVFMDVTLVDIRKIESTVDGLHFVKADATTMDIFADNTQDSLSSLHAAEHFGLGRYGDPVDPDACFQFIRALQRVLKPGGRLYFSVPIGRERLVFNAHRIFSPITILEAFDGLSLVSFSTLTRGGNFIIDANPNDYLDKDYGFGFFETAAAS